jgi:hypothetical protein
MTAIPPCLNAYLDSLTPAVKGLTGEVKQHEASL